MTTARSLLQYAVGWNLTERPTMTLFLILGALLVVAGGIWWAYHDIDVDE